MPACACEQQIDAAVRKLLAAAIPRGLLINADSHKIAAVASQIEVPEFDACGLVEQAQIGEGNWKSRCLEMGAPSC